GHPVTYPGYAALAGRPAATRAAALACARNAVALFVPCHRVVKTDGGLAGYRWGVRVKRWLLAHAAGTRPTTETRSCTVAPFGYLRRVSADVDAPRRLPSTLWRIRRCVRPYLGTMLWMFGAAAGATGASIVVPLVVARVVDGPVRHHQVGGLLVLGA